MAVSEISENKDDKRKRRDPSKPHVRVEVRADETAEGLIRRFQREVLRSGLIQRMKELEHYEKPSKRKKRDEELRRKFKRYEWLKYVSE